MKKHFNTILSFAVILIGVAAGCQKDQTHVSPDPEDRKPFAMVYEEFITPDDIVINSADTTSITVSKTYADKIGVTEFKGRVLLFGGPLELLHSSGSSTMQNWKRILLRSQKGYRRQTFQTVINKNL